MDPQKRLGIVSVVGRTRSPRTNRMRKFPADSRMHLVNATCRGERIIELTKHHREHVAKRALEASYDVGSRFRVMLDRECDLRMRELHERCATTAEKHGQIA